MTRKTSRNRPGCSSDSCLSRTCAGWRDGQLLCRGIDESVGDEEMSAGMSHLDVG